MTVVAATNRVNRPYFFIQKDGARMEVPAFGRGQGDLEGAQLREFNMYVKAGQLSSAEAQDVPENTDAPVLTGTPEVGQVLSVTNGTWTGEPTYKRQWKADGANISGATGMTHTLQPASEGKEITVTVTATNDAGSATADSNALGPVAPAEDD